MAAGAGPPAGRRRGWGLWALVVVALVAVAVVAWIVGAGSGNDDDLGFRDATVERILGEPAEFLGARVVVTGQVARVIVGSGGDGDGGAAAFTLVPEGESPREDTGAQVPQAADEQLLVLNADGRPVIGTPTGGLVQAAGVVRAFRAGAFGEATGREGAFGGAAFRAFEGRPVLVATAVDPTVGITSDFGPQDDVPATGAPGSGT